MLDRLEVGHKATFERVRPEGRGMRLGWERSETERSVGRLVQRYQFVGMKREGAVG